MRYRFLHGVVCPKQPAAQRLATTAPQERALVNRLREREAVAVSRMSTVAA